MAECLNELISDGCFKPFSLIKQIPVHVANDGKDASAQHKQNLLVILNTSQRKKCISNKNTWLVQLSWKLLGFKMFRFAMATHT